MEQGVVNFTPSTLCTTSACFSLRPNTLPWVHNWTGRWWRLFSDENQGILHHNNTLRNAVVSRLIYTSPRRPRVSHPNGGSKVPAKDKHSPFAFGITHSDGQMSIDSWLDSPPHLICDPSLFFVMINNHSKFWTITDSTPVSTVTPLVTIAGGDSN